MAGHPNVVFKSADTVVSVSGFYTSTLIFVGV